MLTIYINYTTEYGEAPSQVSVSIENETGFTFTEEYLPELTADGYQFDGWMLDGSLIRVGDVSNIISIDTTFNLVAHWTQEKGYWSNATGGFGFPKTYILTDENGNELTGIYVESETVFTATDNDVREGMVYAGDGGKSVGSKIIPNYYASCGKKFVLKNNEATITVPEYNYNNLIVTIFTYNTSLSQSVVSTYVSIDDAMYVAGSDTKVSDIIVDEENEQINLGIIANEKSVLRYFILKEEY